MGGFELGLGRFRSARELILVLGDQLDLQASWIERADPLQDVVLMAEVEAEGRHQVNHKQRIALFLAAMRHHAIALTDRGWRLRYVRLEDGQNTQRLDGELARAIERLKPQRVRVVEPGDLRVRGLLQQACDAAGIELQLLDDHSFTCTRDEFRAWAAGRKELTMEFFYRERRRRLDVLMDAGAPEGGQWNFDKENRQSFKQAPTVRRHYRPRRDPITEEVLTLVEQRFPDAIGSTAGFDWPVRADQAHRALDDFIEHRLRGFGTYEDAMWADEPVLYHSRLAASLNLKLLRPMDCVDAAVAAYRRGQAPLNDVEGFVRQIIGWREFIRGVYYLEGEGYVGRNALEQHGRLPAFYWNGETEMRCLRHCVGDVIAQAWGHHIPRLMVLGNFALIAGVAPLAVHQWFLGMYTDAVEWVTAPNVVGMSQHADGGVVGTKPYAASGKYIQRMSNYCKGCRYDVKQRTGEDACPFNTFYWDFLIRHRQRFRSNRRMAMILKNVDRLKEDEREALVGRADRLRRALGIQPE